MGTWRITADERDAAGNIKLNSDAPAEPRSLADLLPKAEDIRKDAARVTPRPLTRSELGALAAVALLSLAIFAYAWGTPTAPPVARPTPVATVAATPAPTAAPVTAVAALVAYFDYADPESATAIEAHQIARVVGQASRWRLVEVGTARVWIAAEQVPEGVPADTPLPDLAPPPPRPAPAPAVQPARASVKYSESIRELR